MSRKKPDKSRLSKPPEYGNESFQRSHSARRRKQSNTSGDETLRTDETFDADRRFPGTGDDLKPAASRDNVHDAMAKEVPPSDTAELEELERQLADSTLSKTNLRAVAQGLLIKLKNVILLPTGLSSEQRRIFEGAFAVSGTDAKARKSVEAKLRGLEGQPVSEALVIALGRLLRSRGWGIRLETGHVASVAWLRDGLRKTGGRLQLNWMESEESERIRRSVSKFPRLHIVDAHNH